MQPLHLRGGHQTDMRRQKPAFYNNKGGWNKGAKAGVALGSDIPMYDAASASQERLYIVPAAARHRPPAPRQPGSAEQAALLTPRGTKRASPLSSPSVAPPPSAPSEAMSGGGPLELAALFEQGPGWRRSVSVEAGLRVQVVSRSASKGGAWASRAARHADNVDVPR